MSAHAGRLSFSHKARLINPFFHGPGPSRIGIGPGKPAGYLRYNSARFIAPTFFDARHIITAYTEMAECRETSDGDD
ncbi:MAG: hypothetical protein DRQ37_08470 [Gammaproteobacteria bacterium]|nr:MAG: hypothetical protein DRQ37_08470 [Gammaproteobacteria bacterium]